MHAVDCIHVDLVMYDASSTALALALAHSYIYTYSLQAFELMIIRWRCVKSTGLMAHRRMVLTLIGLNLLTVIPVHVASASHVASYLIVVAMEW